MTAFRIPKFTGQPPVCPACREQQWRWLDTRPQQQFPRLGIVSHAAYDGTTAGVRDNRRARHGRWRNLVLDQIAGIADDCRRNGHLDEYGIDQDAVVTFGAAA